MPSTRPNYSIDISPASEASHGRHDFFVRRSDTELVAKRRFDRLNELTNDFSQTDLGASFAWRATASENILGRWFGSA